MGCESDEQEAVYWGSGFQRKSPRQVPTRPWRQHWERGGAKAIGGPGALEWTC